MEKLAEGYNLIEAPLWDPSRGLIFSDVLEGGVFCIDAGGQTRAIFAHRRGIGGMSAHVDGGLVVSGRNISCKPFDGGDTVLLLDRDVENNNVGYNDITTDAAGRIYAGSLGSSPVFEDGRAPQAGDLWLIDLDGSHRKVAHDIMLTNGLGFSPDGRTLYHSDSNRQTVNMYEVGEDGSLGEKRSFAHLDQGVPDGLAVSVDGRVWVANASGSGVTVFDAKGNRVDHIEIPQPMCTSVCFGGADLKDLYIVSGSNGMDSDHAGAVYRTRVDVAGIPVPPARVRMPA